MDLGVHVEPSRRMDKASDDLIDQLCTRAGMIMEDANPIALTMPSFHGDERKLALVQLERAAAEISALIVAARSIHPLGD